MFKIVLAVVGIDVAYLAAMFGEYLSPLVLTGSMPGLSIMGVPVPGNTAIAIYYAGSVVMIFSAIVTAIEIVVYLANWFFAKWQNPHTSALQIFFMSLVLACGTFSFGAIAKPFLLYGNDPRAWFGSPHWLILLVLLAPIGFLLVNLLSEAVHDYLRPSVMENEIHDLQDKVKDIRSSLSTIAQNQTNLGGWEKQIDGRLTAIQTKVDKIPLGPPHAVDGAAASGSKAAA